MIVNKRNFNTYLRKYDKGMLRTLKKWSVPRFGQVQSQRWHLESAQKRFTYWLMYKDLFITRHQQVLDVGAGFNGYSLMLSNLHHYIAVDKFYNAKGLYLRESVSRDWYDCAPTTHDIVIANDIFPNVDQRLGIFIDQFRSCCKEIRLSLTFFDKEPRWYQAKRTTGDETLCVCGWSADQLLVTLRPYRRFIDIDISSIKHLHSSIFDNGRQVAIIKIRGGLR